jgi:hypothetical protein
MESMKLPQLSIRDLLWFLVVVGLSIALWNERAKNAKHEYDNWQWKAESLANKWREVGGDVQWIDSGNGNGWAANYTEPGN